MTPEEFNKAANKWADNMVWALVDMNRKAQDDERDFLVQEYKDLQEHFTKELQKENEKLQKDLCVALNNFADGYQGSLSIAKEIIRELLGCLQQDTNDPETNYWVVKYIEKAEAFLESDKG